MLLERDFWNLEKKTDIKKYNLNMKNIIKIRQNVFETNSSSTHSISISDIQSGDMLDNIIPNENGDVILIGGNFGWNFESYNDATTKANYVAVLLLILDYFIRRQHDNEYFRTMGSWAINNYNQCFNNFISVLEEQTGGKVKFLASMDYNSSYYSNIDHQSAEDIEDFDWLLNEKKIKDFIFNPNSWLLTGNDNDQQEWVFKNGENTPTLQDW